MRFSVCNRFLHPTSVGEREYDVSDVPVLVFVLFEKLNPFVRNGHTQTIIKTHSAFFDRAAECGHSRHVLITKF